MNYRTSSYQTLTSCKLEPEMYNAFKLTLVAVCFGVLSHVSAPGTAVAQQTVSGYSIVTPTDPSTPPAPNVSVVPGNGRVTLYWDDVAEGFVDPVLASRNLPQSRRRNFEGYKIYKSTDPQFLDAFAITDNKGNIQGYRPIAQFDRDNGIREYHPAAINGMRVWLGTDTGIQRIFVDEDVINGKLYYYAVVAFTHGDALPDFSVPLVNPSTGEPYPFPPPANTVYTHSPRESLLDKSVNTSTGEIRLGKNVVRVMPNAGAAGYQEAVDPVVQRISGSAGGSIAVSIVDPSKALPNTTYSITFEDTIIAGTTSLDPDLIVTKSFTLTNLETGAKVFDRDERFRSEQLLIRDGLLVEITNAGDTVRVNNELSRWNSQSNRTIHTFQFGVNTRFSKLADYKVEFYDEPVSRSTNYTLRVGALNLTLPAEDVNFKVFNTTDGTEIPFAFFVNPNIPRDLRDIVFLNENRGITVGGAGQIRVTSNGGETWNNVVSPTTKRLNSVYFVNETTGWAVGEDGAIIKSNDGGNTWDDLELNTTRDLYGVHFINESTGIAVGDQGWIIRTTDGGFSWNTVVSNSNRLLRAVVFTDATTGVIVGNASEVLRTTDGGLTWNREGVTFQGGTAADLFRNLTAVDFVDANTGWMVGFLGVIWRTDNGGLTWVRQRPPQNVLLNDVAFTNATTGLTVGANGTIFGTIDGGSTWTLQSSGTTTPLNAVTTTGSSVAYAAGDGPTILNTETGGQVWARTTTEKRFRSFVDANGLPRSDEIYFIENFGTESNVVTWKVSMLPNTRLGTVDPGEGDELELVTIKPFTRADEYRFRVTDQNLPRVESVLVEDVLKAIKVVPNPYVVTHVGEPNPFGSSAGVRQLHFTHLPVQCTIRVFNVSGQLVQTINVNNNPGVNRYIWDMRNSSGHEIPYGVYIYHVEAPGVGEMTGKFAVIK
jgi:photosystem II stability/assembly factor-like uncharacterized protein